MALVRNDFAAEGSASTGTEPLARNRPLLRADILVFGLLLALALVPVLTTRIPAMVDYPNHLARMFVIARDGTADPQPIYRVAWALYPNLAVDLIVPRVGRLIGVELAMRLFLLLSQLLIVGGAVAIEFAVKRRFAWSGFVAILTLYSLPFAWGFVNFEFALGLALWGIAGWLALERRPGARFAVHAAAVAALFVAHLFALGLYGVALGLHELWRMREDGWPLRRLLARGAILAAPVVPAFLLLELTGGAVGRDGTTWAFAAKPLWLMAILNGDNLVVSVGSVAILGGLAAVLHRRGALRLTQSGPWLLAGFALLYLVMPFKLFDTAFVDMRVIVGALLIVPAFLDIRWPTPRWKTGAAVVAAGVICANLGVVIATWTSYASSYDAMIRSFGNIRQGSRVLIGSSGDAPDPPMTNLSDYPMYNAPTLAVHFADAFVPTLFTSIGKQPITARSDADRALSIPYGGPVPRDVLVAAAEGRAAAETPSYVAAWPKDYDYVYLVGERATNPLPQLLQPVDAGPRFTLYRIVKRP